ncbi:Ig-like domain-containing protein [Thalassotalea mangrovi]|uniref:Ig-like domain-containing protein n=1 Tax=Thalassotalea mangrovi TaxID=2572245 RepID=A0A4U1B2C6_9GAMM|nr:Ig-like domain-containing protein [Thalassotalea mangrovi]TKB43678.1 Ig-like domain-containing protein [Thalassotalea mangrovi]
MKTNLLTKTILASAVLVGLSACGTDEGYNPGYGNDNGMISFADASFSAEFAENSGEQRVDLLQGASVDGVALADTDGAKFIKNIDFVEPEGFTTPQAESNTIPNHRISPFTIDGTELVINTELFSESLRECDNTGNFPSTVTYQVTYEIDNGYEGGAAERLLELTFNAIPDPVTEVVASSTEVQAGGTVQMAAYPVPDYVCNASLNYAVADTSIATVDGNGLVTGLATGTTDVVISSVSTPEQQTTVTITVTPGFVLNVDNGDVDENGVATGLKDLPACVATGVTVSPTSVADDLTGDYQYQWTSSNDSGFAILDTLNKGFGETAVVKTTDMVGESSNIDIALLSGFTGSTPIAEVQDRTLTVNSVKNEMCDPGVSENALGFNTDFNLDAVGAPYKGNLAGFAASSDAVSGEASVQITAGSVVTAEGTPYTMAAQQVWNKQRHWYSWNYGRGFNSIGKTYKYAVWVKLEQQPSEPVTLRHIIVPWIFDGIEEGAQGFPGRYTEGGAAIFTAELEANTEWQFIEFVEDKSQKREWSIPNTWSTVTDVFTVWEIYGLPAGNTILLDDYSVVRTDDL